MKALIVGGGGREHALAWKLRRDEPSLEIFAAPGNPGIAGIGTCVPIQANDISQIVQFAAARSIDLTIVGPEAPLAAGVADGLVDRGLPVFGPSRAAARIESSKRFAKTLMLEAGIPTAAATWHSNVDSAKQAVREVGAPVVIKASGLASGKGVFVCGSMEEADFSIDTMLREHIFGEAGAEILVEEYMEGEELSVFALTDGENFRVMLPAQDHKRLLDGDRGPNTGGMGAYAPVGIATPEILEEVEDRIIRPVLHALREHESLFRGLLYCGLMLTRTGPRVVEFNCRFGDPETQALVPLLRSNLFDLMLRCARHAGLEDAPELSFSSESAVTTVLATAGYPDRPRLGAPITLPAPVPDVTIFHAGTRTGTDGQLETAGGRVLAVTAVAPSLEEAQQLSLSVAEEVDFAGRQFRSDIGWREIGRRARAT